VFVRLVAVLVPQSVELVLLPVQFLFVGLVVESKAFEFLVVVVVVVVVVAVVVIEPLEKLCPVFLGLPEVFFLLDF